MADADGTSMGPVHTWRVHLAARRGAFSLGVAAILLLVSVGVGWLYRAPVYGLLSAVVLFGSTASYWIPRRYRLYPDRVEIVYGGRWRPVGHPWSRFRACFVNRDALLLSPTGRPDGLARFRGLTLFLPPEHDAIVAYVRSRVERDEAA